MMRVGKHQLDSFASDFKHWAAHHLKHRTVINLNKDSGVDCWPKAMVTYNEELTKQKNSRTWDGPYARAIPPSPVAGRAEGQGSPAREGK